jgi:amino acid transporter
MRLIRDPREADALRVRGAAPSTQPTAGHGEAPRSETSSPARTSPPRRIGLSALVCLIFFTVSGGAFGLEPLVASVGPGWAVVLVLVTPLLWGLPIALMVAELSAALPEEGGYYIWVREGLGDFWGVQEGW